jgi:hypothetical protein
MTGPRNKTENVSCEVRIEAEEAIIYNLRCILSAEVQASSVTEFKSRQLSFVNCAFVRLRYLDED